MQIHRQSANTARETSRALVEFLENRRLLAGIVRPDHIVIVVEQDRASDGLGNPNMPYLNQLAANGLLYSNTHSVTHPTQPNMHALYSGSTQGITSNWTNQTFTTQPNLAKSLFDAGFSFTGYAETMPADGSQATIVSDGTYPDAYVRYSNPMAQYTSLGTLANGQARPNSAVNRTFAAFSSIPRTDYSSLPTVSFVIPNNMHSTHGSNETYPWAGSPDEENNNILRKWADDWLRDNINDYLVWARTHNSLLIVTGDEERYTGGYAPNLVTVVDGDPRLFTPGTQSSYYNHYNLLRTITDMYGLSPLGASATASAYATDAFGRLSSDVLVPVNTTTSLAASTSSLIAGQSLTLTATVSAASGTAGGSVTFKDGSTAIGTVNLDSAGKATLTTSALAAGSHGLSAVYSGSSSFNASTSAVVTVNVQPVSSNDSFANRITLSGSSATDYGNNRYATKQSGEPRHAGNKGGKSLWWSWTAPASGSVTIHTAGSDFDTLLGVYTGSSVSGLSTVASNDNSGTLKTSKVTFSAVAGRAYRIAVDGRNGAWGNVTLSLSQGTAAKVAAKALFSSTSLAGDDLLIL